MNITKEQFNTMWYQDARGNNIFIDKDAPEPVEGPDNATIIVTRYANVIRTEYSTIIKQADVDACKHPADSVHPTGGWVDGHEGRKCDACGGRQSKSVKEEWPTQWNTSSSIPLCNFSTSWNPNLIEALVLSGDYTIPEAIILATESCERCLNVLYYNYGLSDGYPEYSKPWKKAGTSCKFCEGPQEKTPPVSVIRILRKHFNILHIQLNQTRRKFMRRNM